MERKRSVRRYRRKKSFWDKCKDYIRSFIAFLFSNVGIIGLVIGYTVAGSSIFMNIEGQAPREKVSEMKACRNDTADKLWELTQQNNVLNEWEWRMNVTWELEKYQNKVVDAIRNGYDASGEEDYSKQWTFAGAFLYSLTVITTIGYGNVCPKTPWGKLTTIVYAIIGMPLFLLYLSNIGDILARSFKWIYAKCCLCKGCPGVARRRAERSRSRAAESFHGGGLGAGGSFESWQDAGDVELEGVPQGYRRGSVGGPGRIGFGSSDEDITTTGDDDSVEAMSEMDPQTVTVPLTICLAIMVGYICGGAILFIAYEEWNFLDGSYFCFISLSTIGFGDIVPGDKIYKGQGLDLGFILCSMYLMLGMALIAMCFNLMQEEVIHKIRHTMRSIKYIFRCHDR